MLNNFRYTHYKKNKHNVSHWRCVQYHKGCRAQIKTYDNKMISNANPIHNHGLASSATASRARQISTSTPKTVTDLDRKIAILQKLLNTKSTNNKAFNRNSSKKNSNLSKNSSNEDETDSIKHSSNEDESDSSKHSSNEDESDYSKHTSNEGESDSIEDESDYSKHSSNKKGIESQHNKTYNKNKKPIKWVKY